MQVMLFKEFLFFSEQYAKQTHYMHNKSALNPCHTRVASLKRSHSVLKNAERRVARCANASNAVQTLWKRRAIA